MERPNLSEEEKMGDDKGNVCDENEAERERR